MKCPRQLGERPACARPHPPPPYGDEHVGTVEFDLRPGTMFALIALGGWKPSEVWQWQLRS